MPANPDIVRCLRLDEADPTVDWRVVVHEAGHAMVATALGHSRVTRMTLLPSGGETVRRQGHNAALAEDIAAELATHLAGRAAEMERLRKRGVW
jgi:cell division protease FtsH